MSLSSIQIDLGAGGGYEGPDTQAHAEFQRIADNWGKLRMLLEESGVIPPLIVQITSAYAAGYAWSEVSEEDDGTYTVLAGGRQSGAGVYPRAFEQNQGTADFTNLIVELCLSRDKDTSAVTANFDGSGARVVASDVINPTALSFNSGSGVLTLSRKTLQRDIKGRVMGTSTPADLTATISLTGGAVDLKNNGTTAKAGASFINIPTTNGSTTILEFVANGAGGDLQLKSGADYKVPLYLSGAWTLNYPKFH